MGRHGGPRCDTLGIRPNSGWRIHTSANSSTLKSTSQSGSCLGSERDKLESCAFGRNNAKSSIRTAVDPGDVSGFAWRGSLGLQTSACDGQAVAIMRLSAAALGLAALLQKGHRLTRRRSSEARSVCAQQWVQSAFPQQRRALACRPQPCRAQRCLRAPRARRLANLERPSMAFATRRHSGNRA